MGDVDEMKMERILNEVSEIITHFSGNTPATSSGSTDCNISYSQGIEGCCFGGYIGQGAHTREEKVEIASLECGMNIVMHFVLNYFA